MSEMVERVAKAMRDRAKEPLGNIKSLEPVSVGSLGDAWRCLAVAAIEAMKEPTKQMIYEGNSKVSDCIDFWNYDSGAGYSVEPHAARDTWQTMIDEALR